MKINRTKDINREVEVVAIVTLNKIIFDSAEVFCFAVAKKCKRIIIVHKAPSGIIEPRE